MKTYAQIRGNDSFDWNKFLNKRKISDIEWASATRKAGDWITCACGNQCAIIPRYGEDGKPLDEQLQKLGGLDGFYGAIKIRDKKKAKAFLKEIEKRSDILIKEIKAYL